MSGKQPKKRSGSISANGAATASEKSGEQSTIYEKYEKVKDIGKGSFGRVALIKRRADDKVLVWKELNYGKMSEKEKQMLVSEVNILRELNHPNVVRYYDRVIDRAASKIYIVMEYCEGGDISTLIKNSRKEKQYLPEDMIWIILSQILLALQACHTRKEGKILHRDLKPGNIFLDNQNNVKLGDFGLSKMMGEESVFAYTHVGTPYYMSPEQINDQKYNEKSDVWSAGCIIYELAALRAPFEATTHLQLANKIRAGNLARIPAQYTDELMKVIRIMLEQKAEKRPSVQDLLGHEQIQVRVLEKKYKDKYTYLKKKEQEIAKREKELPQSSLELPSEDDEETQAMEEMEKKLMADIERTEREDEEINRCIQQNNEVMKQLKERMEKLQKEVEEEEDQSADFGRRTAEFEESMKEGRQTSGFEDTIKEARRTGGFGNTQPIKRLEEEPIKKEGNRIQEMQYEENEYLIKYQQYLEKTKAQTMGRALGSARGNSTGRSETYPSGSSIR